MKSFFLMPMGRSLIDCFQCCFSPTASLLPLRERARFFVFAHVKHCAKVD